MVWVGVEGREEGKGWLGVSMGGAHTTQLCGGWRAGIHMSDHTYFFHPPHVKCCVHVCPTLCHVPDAALAAGAVWCCLGAAALLA